MEGNPMNADIFPVEILTVLLVEFLFGIGYNFLVAWLHRHQLIHVSFSVVFGVIGTLLIPAIAWFDHEMSIGQTVALLTLCFAASGIPMIVGSNLRTVNGKDDKKRRPWPTAANQVREDVIMELSMMAHEIAESAKNDTLTAGDLPDYVDRLHGLVGMLKSV